MTVKMTKHLIASLAPLTDDQLKAAWDAISIVSDNRIKTGRNKGMLKLRTLKRSDELLTEIIRRRTLKDAAAHVEIATARIRPKTGGYVATAPKGRP
jgi:hypothetical protein